LNDGFNGDSNHLFFLAISKQLGLILPSFDNKTELTQRTNQKKGKDRK